MPETIRDVLSRAAERIASSEALHEAELLLGHVLACERSYFYTWPDKILSPDQQLKFEQLLQRRVSGEPVAYILGEWAFWNLNLEVNPSTLIPRPDTECLVERSLQLNLSNYTRVLDLGCGTGAIALALAKERPQWQLVACDINDEAVALATRNCLRNQIENVQIVRSIWFEKIQGRFDLIISNPPYIDEHDEHLSELHFEPRTALVSADQGLADIQQIVEQSPEYLNPDGYLILEHGWKQGAAVRALLEASFADVCTEKDHGGNERLTMGSLKRV